MKNIFFSILGFLFTLQVFADDEAPRKLKSPYKEGSGIETIFDFINFVLNNIVLPIGAAIAVFMLIYSGFLFVTARGDVEKLSKAKTGFLWTVIGIGILLGSVAISLAIRGTICQIANIPSVCD